MGFVHEDFLLSAKTARRLYHDFAEDEPILDYHNHLSSAEIASDRQFHNLFEIWLEGDHYKWRAMRANGVDERFCTGDATPFEKFQAWARTVPHTLRNPLYHWTHLELKRYFGIDELLDGSNRPLHLGPRQCDSERRRPDRAPDSPPLPRARTLHHRRSLRRPRPSQDPRRERKGVSRLSCVPAR